VWYRVSASVAYVIMCDGQRREKKEKTKRKKEKKDFFSFYPFFISVLRDWEDSKHDNNESEKNPKDKNSFACRNCFLSSPNFFSFKLFLLICVTQDYLLPSCFTTNYPSLFQVQSLSYSAQQQDKNRGEENLIFFEVK